MKKRVLITIVSVLMLCVFAFALTACNKAPDEVMDMAKYWLVDWDENNAYGSGFEVLKVEYAKFDSYEIGTTGIDLGNCYFAVFVVKFTDLYGIAGYSSSRYLLWRDSNGDYRADAGPGGPYIAEKLSSAKEKGEFSKSQLKELNKYIKENKRDV